MKNISEQEKPGLQLTVERILSSDDQENSDEAIISLLETWINLITSIYEAQRQLLEAGVRLDRATRLINQALINILVKRKALNLPTDNLEV